MKESDIYTKILNKQEIKIYMDKYCKDWDKYCKDWEEKNPNIQYAASDGTDWILSEDSINWTKAENML